MTEKVGKNFEWVRSQSYPEPNMNWFVSSTQNITNINYIILVRANPKKSINGFVTPSVTENFLFKV